jgi:hypothetical protein
MYRNANKHEQDGGKSTDHRKAAPAVGGRNRGEEVPAGVAGQKYPAQGTSHEEVKGLIERGGPASDPQCVDSQQRSGDQEESETECTSHRSGNQLEGAK